MEAHAAVLREAEARKVFGNDRFAASDFASAIAAYEETVELLARLAREVSENSSATHSQFLLAVKSLLASTFSNLSAAYLRTGDAGRAVLNADCAIRVSSKWVKGYLRKIAALLHRVDSEVSSYHLRTNAENNTDGAGTLDADSDGDAQEKERREEKEGVLSRLSSDVLDCEAIFSRHVLVLDPSIEKTSTEVHGIQEQLRMHKTWISGERDRLFRHQGFSVLLRDGVEPFVVPLGPASRRHLEANSLQSSLLSAVGLSTLRIGDFSKSGEDGMANDSTNQHRRPPKVHPFVHLFLRSQLASETEVAEEGKRLTLLHRMEQHGCLVFRTDGTNVSVGDVVALLDYLTSFFTPTTVDDDVDEGGDVVPSSGNSELDGFRRWHVSYNDMAEQMAHVEAVHFLDC